MTPESSPSCPSSLPSLPDLSYVNRSSCACLLAGQPDLTDKLCMGTQVFKAELDGAQDVAVKFLKSDTTGHDERSQRAFADEVSIIRESRDPNIVGFRGAWLSAVCSLSCMIGGGLPDEH